jgi:hypothetical protein
MASFPFVLLEARCKEMAEGLRWRWRTALRKAAQIVESDLRKAIDLTATPPPDEIQAHLDALLLDLNEQALVMLREGLGLAIAAGQWAMAQTWEGVFVQPTASDLAAIRRPATFQDSSAMRFALAYGASAVKTQDAAVLGRFKLHLLDALREGDSPRKAAQQTAEALGEDPSTWERIARTEMARAQHFGSVEEAKRLGVEYVVVPDQPKNCEACRRLLANRVFPRAALESASNVGRKPSAWVAAIPMHPNCTCVAIPAASSTIQGARALLGGAIPSTGASIEDLPEPKDR